MFRTNLPLLYVVHNQLFHYLAVKINLHVSNLSVQNYFFHHFINYFTFKCNILTSKLFFYNLKLKLHANLTLAAILNKCPSRMRCCDLPLCKGLISAFSLSLFVYGYNGISLALSSFVVILKYWG